MAIEIKKTITRNGKIIIHKSRKKQPQIYEIIGVIVCVVGIVLVVMTYLGLT